MALDERLHRFSTAEYDEIVATGALADVRVELLDGLLVDKVSPQSEQHAQVTIALQELFALRRPGLGLQLRVQMPLAVGDHWVPEPDVALAYPDPDPATWPRSALIVVEVAVTSKQTDLRKAPVYAGAAIPRYWLVDVPAGTVLEHADPRPDGYGSVTVLRGDDVLDAHVDGVPATTVAQILSAAR